VYIYQLGGTFGSEKKKAIDMPGYWWMPPESGAISRTVQGRWQTGNK